MVSINTNLSSLIVQTNLTKSTNALNLAIERMTTGCKINHAKDNAAGYSIANDMDSKLSSYNVAQDNIAAGIDLVATAQDTISLMQTHGQRIHALITQAHNGTYGASSLQAIQSEVNARLNEINRLYRTTEYNGIDLLKLPMPDWAEGVQESADNVTAKAEYNGFVADPIARDNEGNAIDVDSLTSVAGLSDFSSKSAYKIANKADLEHFRDLVNEGKSTEHKSFYLAADIDLGEVEGDVTNWTPIGDWYDVCFEGTFDGNGHKVYNMNIYEPDQRSQGLFANIDEATIKNLRVDCSVTGSYDVGGIAASTDSLSTITNCYVIGTVTGTIGSTGGLVGSSQAAISNCYTACIVSETNSDTGGLVGYALGGSVTNCYATGNVTGKTRVGGLIGQITEGCTVSNSYATGNVTGNSGTGGLVGSAEGGSVTNCYATGNVTGKTRTGGLVGSASGGSVTNCYATGTVTSTGNTTGGLVGFTSVEISNSYATGNVSGKKYTGGLVGLISKTSGTLNLDNIASFGSADGTEAVGSLIGGVMNTSDGTNFSTINISNAQSVIQNLSQIGGTYSSASGTPAVEYDMSTWLSNIAQVSLLTSLQVGINGDSSSQISFITSFDMNLNVSDVTSNGAYDSINNFLESLSTKATELGAISNRLESALESASVSVDNITSSRSTIKDADIAQVSSEYIRQQILQQASATLLATANQTPSIALQLI